MPSNSEQFEQLAQRVSLRILHRHRNNVADMEAILYGQAGLLPPIPVDGYSAELLYRFTNFKYKYDLIQLDTQIWNFQENTEHPAIRISQLAALLNQEEDLFNKCADVHTELSQLQTAFQVTANEYWNDHHQFGVFGAKKPNTIDHEFAGMIIEQVVVPIRNLTASFHNTNPFLASE